METDLTIYVYHGVLFHVSAVATTYMVMEVSSFGRGLEVLVLFLVLSLVGQ